MEIHLTVVSRSHRQISINMPILDLMALNDNEIVSGKGRVYGRGSFETVIPLDRVFCAKG